MNLNNSSPYDAYSQSYISIDNGRFIFEPKHAAGIAFIREQARAAALEAAARVCDEAVYNERPASPQHAAAIRAIK